MDQDVLSGISTTVFPAITVPGVYSVRLYATADSATGVGPVGATKIVRFTGDLGDGVSARIINEIAKVTENDFSAGYWEYLETFEITISDVNATIPFSIEIHGVTGQNYQATVFIQRAG